MYVFSSGFVKYIKIIMVAYFNICSKFEKNLFYTHEMKQRCDIYSHKKQLVMFTSENQNYVSMQVKRPC